MIVKTFAKFLPALLLEPLPIPDPGPEALPQPEPLSTLAQDVGSLKNKKDIVEMLYFVIFTVRFYL